MAERRDVKLGELFLSTRRLRFLHLKSQDEILLQSKVCGKYPTLFLGADVLSNCSISVPNLPRTHARYAKKGLSTKVNFPNSVRISGIQGTSNGVWFYNIQGLFKVAFEMYSREEQLEVLQRLQPLWTIRFKDDLLSEVTHPSQVNEDDVFVQSVQQVEAATSTETVTNNTKGNQLEKSPVKDHRQHELEKKYTEFKKELKNFMNINIKQNKYNECDNVMSALMEILCGYKTMATDVEIDDQERLLCTVSQWVGREFRKNKSAIEFNATEFKKKHIATINKLPPAEALIREIFPTSMIVLLKTWMDIEAMKTESEKWLPFPLMQLILEFANQTLVSGVSHVLYSRLVRTDSV